MMSSTAAATPSAAFGGTSSSRGEGILSNRFILTANIEANDGGKEIAYGNGKVVRARLSDALYFWKTDQSDLPDLDQLKGSAEKFGLDLAKPLDQRMARLDHLGVTFHAKLGTQGERVERIARLAEELAPIVGADPKLARRASVLAKADLQTEVVGEFPELQGAMGHKYALLQGEHTSVAAAIEEHYKPQGPSDRVPTDPVSVAVALADKLDTLVGFWAIDEKPTGSKDPYALRRAALGVIRIFVENGIPASLISICKMTSRHAAEQLFHSGVAMLEGDMETVDGKTEYFLYQLRDQHSPNDEEIAIQIIDEDGCFTFGQSERGGFREYGFDLLSFFHDRLKVYLRDQGARHDLIDAVLAGGGSAPSLPLAGRVSAEPTGGGGSASPWSQASSPGEIGQPSETASSSPPPPGPSGHPPRKGEGNTAANDDLLMIVRRVEALSTFLDTEDGRNLLAGTKRAVNILSIESKRGTLIAEAVDPALLREEAEKALFAAVNRAESQAAQAIQNEDFSAAMRALSALREPVDSFFECVLVNDEDVAIRANRLALLARIRAATGQVADFSKIAG